MDQHSLRVIEGRPWREAVICALDPEAPLDPWHGVGAVEPGDGVIVVLHTDPRTVLTTFICEPDRDIRTAIARKFWRGNALRTVADVEQRAGGRSLADSVGAELDSPAVAALWAAADEYGSCEPDFRVGTSSAVAARILLHSGGRCTCCGEKVGAADLSVHPVSAADFRSHRDWPAALCPGCVATMEAAGLSSVVDYGFTLQPACPACSARRTRTVSYGMMSYAGSVNRLPWESQAGCVVGSAGRFSCGECGHAWGGDWDEFDP